MTTALAFWRTSPVQHNLWNCTSFFVLLAGGHTDRADSRLIWKCWLRDCLHPFMDNCEKWKWGSCMVGASNFIMTEYTQLYKSTEKNVYSYFWLCVCTHFYSWIYTDFYEFCPRSQIIDLFLRIKFVTHFKDGTTNQVSDLGLRDTDRLGKLESIQRWMMMKF